MTSAKYNHQEIEAKWRAKWEQSKLYKTPEIQEGDKKKYILEAFPYPSGDGLHVGHALPTTAGDITARYNVLQGFKVLHPMGFDAFGLPTENFAKKKGLHPQIVTDNSIASFTNQLKRLGANYDWDREINTTKPEYYKWTQWFFQLLYKRGLAYKKEALVNWDPVDQTVLANEQVLSDGTAERSGAKVEQKMMSQWFFKITDYAERLLQDLDALDWPESTKQMQRNWIGKSEGAEVDFQIKDREEKITVFTTRIDTIFSGTYLILAPEHPLIDTLTIPEQKQEISNYQTATKLKSTIERTDLNKDKTAAFTGSFAINPATGDKMPIWVSDFVLANYGTGAVFADSHDERDFELAKKYNIPLKESLEYSIDYPLKEGCPLVKRNVTKAIVKHWEEDKYLVITEKKFDNMKVLVGGGVDDNETLEQAIRREVTEESGYCDFKLVRDSNLRIHNKFYNKKREQNQYSILNAFYIELNSDKQLTIDEEEKLVTSYEWVDKDKLLEEITSEHEKYLVSRIIFDKPFTGYGILYNSGEFDGLNSEEAKPAITKWGNKQGWAKSKTTYRLRDWSIGRQRYWGCPIPIIYDKKPAQILFASTNKDKIKRFKAMLNGSNVNIITLNDLDYKISEPEEYGSNESENAAIKAKHYYNNLKVKMPVISQDDGLLLHNIPDSDNPKDRLKRKAEEMFGDGSDESLHKFLSYLTNKYEVIKAELKWSFCLFDGLNTTSFEYNWKGDLVNTVSEIKHPNAPIESHLMVEVENNKIFASELGEKEFVTLRKNCIEGLGNLIKQIQLDVYSQPTLIPERDLPLLLPQDLDMSSGMIKPLSQNPDFVNSAAAKYGVGCTYECDTMDTFVDSSWYFFRYCSPKNDQAFADQAEMKKWMPIDQYIIGAEHSTLHLLYARFFTKVLFDAGYISFEEPFLKMRHQGMILGPDNQKMSKSKGNVINPNDVFDEYGADTLRLYEMFMGPFDQPKPWNTNSIKGVRRLLDRVWNIQEKVAIKENQTTANQKIEIALNKLIKKVEEDIESFSFNTCVSEFMKFVNVIDEVGNLSLEQYKKFLLVLAPFAPFITEEIWQVMDPADSYISIHSQKWPEYNSAFLVEEMARMVVQINGKVRAQFEINTDSSEEIVVEKAKIATSNWLINKSIKFIKVIPNKLISIVVE